MKNFYVYKDNFGMAIIDKSKECFESFEQSWVIYTNDEKDEKENKRITYEIW